jgi:lipid-binding SYLF domain-containing protein
MAYATTNPPQLLVQGMGDGLSLWSYASTDVHTDVDATDYFSNGDALGMKVNDTVIVTKTSATVGATIHTVTAVTAGGAATVAAAILA